LYINIRLQLADQSLCYPKGILEDVIIRVGQSYVPLDFVVLETGEDESAIIKQQNENKHLAKTIQESSTQELLLKLHLQQGKINPKYTMYSQDLPD
jgi:uncharacterized protein YdeI (YjbR/CyaY-like superfamily)